LLHQLATVQERVKLALTLIQHVLIVLQHGYSTLCSPRPCIVVVPLIFLDLLFLRVFCPFILILVFFRLSNRSTLKTQPNVPPISPVRKQQRIRKRIVRSVHNRNLFEILVSVPVESATPLHDNVSFEVHSTLSSYNRSHLRAFRTVVPTNVLTRRTLVTVNYQAVLPALICVVGSNPFADRVERLHVPICLEQHLRELIEKILLETWEERPSYRSLCLDAWIVKVHGEKTVAIPTSIATRLILILRFPVRWIDCSKKVHNATKDCHGRLVSRGSRPAILPFSMHRSHGKGRVILSDVVPEVPGTWCIVRQKRPQQLRWFRQGSSVTTVVATVCKPRVRVGTAGNPFPEPPSCAALSASTVHASKVHFSVIDCISRSTPGCS